jgi:uroporphyrinogen decarboxylase
MSQMTPRERLFRALRRGVPDRVPCFPFIIRWIRHHFGCTCPYHQLKAAEDLGIDIIALYGLYAWQSVSNDYVYSPAGAYSHSAGGLYGDLSDVSLEMKVQNGAEHVWYDRTFHTPAGDLHDVIQWAKPDCGYGDGPNPHRVEPLVKRSADLGALKYLYPAPRKDMIADIPIMLEYIGDRALPAAVDATHPGAWGMESLGAESMLITSITEPGLLQDVCRVAQDAHLRNLRAMLQQGFQEVYDSWFQCGPSVGWSPKTYKTVFLPLIRESVALAHEFDAIYVYQDDGKMKDIIPALVDAGVDALSGLQPPKVGDVVLRDVKAQVGDRVALVGGLDPCYTFDRGNPSAVREAVRQAISDAGKGGGYILSTAEAVAPETSQQSLRAAAQAAQDFGVYGRDL